MSALTTPRAIAAAGVCLALLVGCAPSTYSSYDGGDSKAAVPDHATVSCSELLETVVTRERTGGTAGAINSELDLMGGACPSEYDVFVDYVSLKGFAEADAGGACSEHEKYDVAPAAIELARQDGLCEEWSDRVEMVDEPWVCRYSPTYDENWHNDVLCTNGLHEDRPHLREWDDFVTEAEIMDSAREYEQQLNAP